MELSLQKIHPLSTRATTRGPGGPKKIFKGDLDRHLKGTWDGVHEGKFQMELGLLVFHNSCPLKTFPLSLTKDIREIRARAQVERHKNVCCCR